ncbi:MAG: LysR substrate-binding domain-containing protein [Pseudomonadota bacterium]
MPDWTPSLIALRAFEAVARTLSYQGAAEELGVTPAAVKQLVAKLEDALGGALVRRRGRGIVLTETGRLGAGDLTLAMRHMADAVKKMRAPGDETRLIVTVEASFAATWLVPRLEGFRSRHPGIDVLIDSSQKIVDLTLGDVDIAIRYGVESGGDLIVRRLFDDAVFPACSPSLAAGPPRLSALRHLAEAPLIHWDLSQQPWATSTRRWFDWGEWVRQMGVEGVSPTKGLRFSDYGLVVQAAISGQGVMLASGPILSDALAAGLLVRPFPGAAQSTGIGYDLVTTPEAAERPDVATFSDWLVGAVGGRLEAGSIGRSEHLKR